MRGQKIKKSIMDRLLNIILGVILIFVGLQSLPFFKIVQIIPFFNYASPGIMILIGLILWKSSREGAVKDVRTKVVINKGKRDWRFSGIAIVVLLLGIVSLLSSFGLSLPSGVVYTYANYFVALLGVLTILLSFKSPSVAESAVLGWRATGQVIKKGYGALPSGGLRRAS
jgi:hypothetical protein